MTDMKNANFPTDPEDRTYHLYLKPGEAAPRIITVGDLPRALAFAKMPGFEIKFIREAPRLFTTVTGLYKGKPVTIITSLMGIPNMDFTIRELRYVCRGPMAVIRVGTCGSPADVKVGDITVPDRYHTVLRNPDAFGPYANEVPVEKAYFISKAIPADPVLRDVLEKNVRKYIDAKIVRGNSVSSCSFYSAQGRIDTNFKDRNEGLIDRFVKEIPDLVSIEMESSHLVDLALNCTQKIHAAAAHIVLAQRRTQDFLTNEQKHKLEEQIGKAALDAIVEFDLKGEEDAPNAVWKNSGEPGGDWAKFKHMFQ